MVQRTTTLWTANRVLALALGLLFTVISIIGFFTPQENSTGVQAVFGIFDVDRNHNIFYLITGLLGIAAAFTGQARLFNRVFGILYILLGLLGLIPALYFPAGAYGTDTGLFLGVTHIMQETTFFISSRASSPLLWASSSRTRPRLEQDSTNSSNPLNSTMRTGNASTTATTCPRKKEICAVVRTWRAPERHHMTHPCSLCTLLKV